MKPNEPAARPRFDEKTFGLLTTGIGDFFSTRFYHTSFLLVAGSRRVQIDLPCPYFKILAEATKKAGLRVSPADIDDFICTHVHGDHSNGLEGLGFYKHYYQKSRPRLFLLPEVAQPLWRHKLFASMGTMMDAGLNPLPSPTLETYFDVRTVTPETLVHFGDVTMSIRRTRHAVPCFGMKFERDGRKIGYSCDTVFDRGLIDWFTDCDLIFHETNESDIHTPYAELTSLDDSLKERIALIHLDDDFHCGDPFLRPAQQGAFYQIA